MAPYYEFVCQTLGIDIDQVKLSKYKAVNTARIQVLDEKVALNLGETEYSDALIAKAQYLCSIGSKEPAVEASVLAFEKTAPTGHKIDILFMIIRIGFFYQDDAIIKMYIDKVKELIEKGGDWDRRNRLKTYEGIYMISKRQFEAAADLLLDTLATFTSTELMEYKAFVNYTVLTASLILNRPDFKLKVLESPEILECIHQIPHLSDYCKQFYSCDYVGFFKNLGLIEQALKLDVYLHPHYRYYVREMRIRVYGQVLESYKSVSIKSMATSFGVSEDWMDNDLSQFISSGRVNAVIDKVDGIVRSNRPDAKNAQYQASIKDGDNLLNSIQKLSRIINV